MVDDRRPKAVATLIFDDAALWFTSMTTHASANTILITGNLPFSETAISEQFCGCSDIDAVVTRAANAEELIELVLAADRCVIVVDWDQEDIPDTIESLKNDEVGSLIPVLAITDDHDGLRIADAFKKGAEMCLRRSENPEYICHNIASLLKLQQVQREMLATLSDLKADAVSSFLLADLIRRYVPETVWNLAQKHAEEQKLVIPHSEMDITVVFADIAGFTRITQHLSPQEAVRRLNAIFEIVTEAVYANDGDIDKFIGDAFFAVFDDPGAAVRAMISIQENVKELNTSNIGRGEDPFLFRIGIHTGAVIRGNVGGGNRYDNTLIGDTVNIASRLESIASPGGIIISEETREKASITAADDEKMEVDLRGRDNPITAVVIYPR